MSLRPLSDRILVQRTAEDEKTKGGIIIPDTAKENRLRAKWLPPVTAGWVKTAN